MSSVHFISLSFALFLNAWCSFSRLNDATTKFNVIYVIDIRPDTFSFTQSISYLSKCILCVWCGFNSTVILSIDALIWCNITILCLLKWSIVTAYIYTLHIYINSKFVLPRVSCWLCYFLLLFIFLLLLYIPCCLLQFDFCNLVTLDFMCFFSQDLYKIACGEGNCNASVFALTTYQCRLHLKNLHLILLGFRSENLKRFE